jgi:hypothetical protein
MLIILTKEWVHNEAKNDANSTIVLPMLLNKVETHMLKHSTK